MLNFDKPQRVRICPSPTGRGHLGLIRQSYLNYLIAKSSQGSLLFRSDDTDPVRSKKEYEDEIFRLYDKYGIEYDSFFRQSERYDRYREVAADMVKAGTAIIRDGVTYLNPHEFETEWEDMIVGKVPITGKDHRPNEEDFHSIRNLALLREDGTPLYNFCSVVDDIDTNITLVCRGNDHVNNTSKQIHIYKALGIKPPLYAHVGLVFFNGKKLSKRDPEASMDFYEKYHPEAVLNAVLKLGWQHKNPNIDKEYPIIDKQTAIKLFPEGHLKAVKSTLDIAKLDWLQKKYGQ